MALSACKLDAAARRLVGGECCWVWSSGMRATAHQHVLVDLLLSEVNIALHLFGRGGDCVGVMASSVSQAVTADHNLLPPQGLDAPEGERFSSTPAIRVSIRVVMRPGQLEVHKLQLGSSSVVLQRCLLK